MAISNHERVGKALELLKEGLRPFVERELKTYHGDRWTSEVKEVLTDTRLGGGKGDRDAGCRRAVGRYGWNRGGTSSGRRWARRNAASSTNCSMYAIAGRIKTHSLAMMPTAHSTPYRGF